MFSAVNITKCLFEENFWKIIYEESMCQIEKNKENNFYAFHKRGEITYVNASNEYDMLFKLYKNTNIFTVHMSIHDEVELSEYKEKQFETEKDLYIFFINYILKFLSEADFYYEKLNVIQ